MTNRSRKYFKKKLFIWQLNKVIRFGLEYAQRLAELSQPLPTYTKGGITKSHIAIAGEKGQELIFAPSKHTFSTIPLPPFSL